MADINDTDGSFEGLAIAVIGMSGRFPGAKDVEQFWKNLCAGVESIVPLTDAELRAAGVSAEELGSGRYVKAAPVLDGVELFDAGLFGYTPLEARVMDPQQRLLLECAWEALEHAGYDPDKHPGERISVFAGTRTSTYLFHVLANRAALQPQDRLLVELGNDVSSLATRLSYKLNLTGPSTMVQTACSTSLVAIHLACQSLLMGECRMALAAATAVNVPHRAGYTYEPGSMLSPDGHVRPFDAKAEGTVFGSGAGVVVLKRLQDALADGDNVLAVVRGSAVNNDGSHKASFTAPSVEGQTEVLLESLACAGLDADAISYLEAHGTGTSLGDPIEILALNNAWRASTDKKGFCKLGTAKGNVGHLDVAAGMAGFIKTVMSLQHRKLPPMLNFTQPNPQIDFASSPFTVNTKLTDWTGTGPLRAGVSSFGFGGTNAHIILEEAPKAAASGPSRPQQLVVLSARSEAALDTATGNLAAWLREHPGASLADVAFTLQMGRKDFDHRRVLVARATGEAAEALASRAPSVLTGVREVGDRPVVFMFPGQGAQHVNMARELYDSEPAFRAEVDTCAEKLKPHLGLDLRTVLYPTAGGEAEATKKLEGTALTQPALFVLEYAMAKLWMAWGVKPRAMVGHSIGEYVAACLAGVFSLDDALALVAKRGALMQSLPAGSMLAVPLPEAEVAPLLEGKLDLAAVNGPAMCVVAGPSEAVDAMEAKLSARGVQARRLHTSHAFHSAMMDPILAPFTEAVRRVRLQAPKLPYVSNVTGTWIDAAQATDPAYWARHLRQPVRFAQGLRELLKDSSDVLLEVGPGQTLGSLAKAQPETAGRTVLSSARHPQKPESDAAKLMGTLGKLWLAGVPVDWKGFHSGQRRRRVPLPGYPFERERYWVDPVEGAAAQTQQRAPAGKNADVADWFHVPAWKPAAPPELDREALAKSRCWVLLEDGLGVGEALARRLAAEGREVVRVRAGTAFAREDARRFVAAPDSKADLQAVLADLEKQGLPADVIVHLWSLTAPDVTSTGAELFRKLQPGGYYSLLALGQALATGTRAVRLEVVSNRLHDLDGEHQSLAEKSPLLTACKVIPQELPHVTARCVEVEVAVPSSPRAERLAGMLVAELSARGSEMLVVLRGTRRYVQAYTPVRLEAKGTPLTPLREGGVYLITGGMGAVGLMLADHLAETLKAKVALLGRTALPERSAWDAWLAGHPEDDTVSRRIRRVKELEAKGAEVLVLAADVADAAQLKAAVAKVEAHFGALHGVLHTAGVTRGDSPYLALTDVRRDAAETQFGPKVYGTYALEEALRGRAVDFVLLFSSSSSVLGGLAHFTYAAGNQFLDAFAESRRGLESPRWVSASWDPWPEETKHTSLRTAMDQYTMTVPEGTQALRRVVQAGLDGQVVVITGDLEPRLRTWVNREPKAAGAQPKKAANRTRRGKTAYVAPSTDLEKAVAALWSELLGVAEVGLHDDFFDLGGHSLLATQLRNQLQATFKVEPPLRSLFENPTVAGLSGLIAKELAAREAVPTKPLAEALRTAFPTERPSLLEDWLRRKVAKVTNRAVKDLPADGSLKGLDLDAIGAELEFDLKKQLKFQLYPHELREHASLPELSRYLLAEMERQTDPARFATDMPLSAFSLRPYRRQASGPKVRAAKKNPSMVFVHSTPRAGSTLFRVMLAGHPRLFCPPELNLLFFETMREWKQNVGFGHEMEWTERGLLWAFMEVLKLDSTAGQAFVDKLVADNVSAQAVYGRLQELSGGRLLVDKTPPYAMDPETLWRGEEMFEQPKYLFLIRHPLPVMESLVRMRFDRLFGPSLFGSADVDPYAVAETVWAMPNQNLLDFYERIGSERVHWVRYEELVSEPARVMKGVSDFLGLPYDEGMVQPYDGKRERMLGGLGDPNILQHTRIEGERSDSWKRIQWPRALDASTRALATRLGYELPEAAPVAPKKSGAAEENRAEKLLENLDNLSDEQVAALLAEMEGNPDKVA
ncbi:type I polyketide synthase [Myxococcus sp. RHSTA-1-4]|uniref:type I polyketide synthase n=1 Tax=Myxococcus sp. RHSTA-1-4 TaxID=2874601 RepID=UPI001CBF2888|nr:type I polyketide synthase [Myxococcus sp. RHSTA-1-4]MBZ4421923.1 SDR family oxidoreductase [Myxococcus sp. RHSTA-1-4]